MPSDSSAFEKVARSKQTNLSLAVVVDGVDKQSNAFARVMFSKEVERILLQNGDTNEADFCRVVRRWYEAEDDPGLTAYDRFLRRMDFKTYLLDGFSFSTFPPPSSHIKGIIKLSSA